MEDRQYVGKGLGFYLVQNNSEIYLFKKVKDHFETQAHLLTHSTQKDKFPVNNVSTLLQQAISQCHIQLHPLPVMQTLVLSVSLSFHLGGWGVGWVMVLQRCSMAKPLP